MHGYWNRVQFFLMGFPIQKCYEFKLVILMSSNPSKYGPSSLICICCRFFFKQITKSLLCSRLGSSNTISSSTRPTRRRYLLGWSKVNICPIYTKNWGNHCLELVVWTENEILIHSYWRFKDVHDSRIFFKYVHDLRNF